MKETKLKAARFIFEEDKKAESISKNREFHKTQVDFDEISMSNRYYGGFCM